jgi:putative membrane protein
MRIGRIGRFAVIGATVLLVACDMGRRDEVTRDEAGTVGTAGVSAGDRNFVEESLSAGMTEVELGRMAQQRAADAEVKQFAEMMVRDHTQAGDSLKQVAQQHAIQTPSEMQDQHRDLMDRLSNVQGADFDREYMEAMVDSHENMVDHLQTRASEDRFGENKGTVRPEGSDNPIEASLNQWAANALPTTRRHLEEARRINDRLNNRTPATRQY